jgi:endonuclease-3 related protein
MPTPLMLLYRELHKRHGCQGWWPILSNPTLVNPHKTGTTRGYHAGDYNYPRTDRERFEICVGAILTQNTAWTNVEKALLALHATGALTPIKLARLPLPALKANIKPAGYYNQKAKKLRIFTKFYGELKGKTPSRDELLALWGIGPETADSILLYAYGVPVFVIDAYTRRVLASKKLARHDADYHDLQKIFHDQLPKDAALFNEFHALLVEHGKRLK